MHTRLHVYIDPNNPAEVEQAEIMRRENDAIVWMKRNPGPEFDIDSPLIDAGVDALFGQHPERGGQERRQAVFAVLTASRQAFIEALNETFAYQIDRLIPLTGQISFRKRLDEQKREIDALKSGHHAVRGDAFEAYLKRWRDKFEKSHGYYSILDQLLDDYRLHADTGVSLTEEVEGP